MYDILVSISEYLYDAQIAIAICKNQMFPTLFFFTYKLRFERHCFEHEYDYENPITRKS